MNAIHLDHNATTALDKARARVARLIGAQPEEIIFTSGGTEANNLAILGVVATSTRSRLRIVTSAVEHQAVLNPCLLLEKAGGSVTFLPVDAEGLLSAAEASSSLREDTLLVNDPVPEFKLHALDV